MGSFGIFKYGRMEHPFLIIAGGCFNNSIIFLDSLDFSQTFDFFPVAKANLKIFEQCRRVSLRVRHFSAFEYGRKEDPFLNIAEVVLIFYSLDFFHKLLIIFSCWDQFGEF